MTIMNAKKTEFRDKELLAQIAERIKLIRNQKNLTQAQFYEISNIHIGRIESGKVNISISTLQEICKHLGITLPEFFGGTSVALNGKGENYSYSLPSEECKELIQLPKELVYHLAHEIKSPVTNLELLTDLISKINSLSEKPAYLQGIKDSVHRLGLMVSALVEIMEVQAIDDLVIKDICLSDIFGFVISEHQSLLEQCKAKVWKDFTKADCFCYNEVFMLKLFTILVSNALKFCKQEHSLEISVEASHLDGYVLIDFQDNGKGINLQRFGEKIFKPFNQLTGKNEGKGIGLYLLKTIVEKNGGYIELESLPQQGTRFKLYLKEYTKKTSSSAETYS